MLVNIGDLTGNALDWAVEQVLLASLPQPERGLLIHQIGYGITTKRYSTDPGAAWPIIEREKINLSELAGTWHARIMNKLIEAEGPTSLVAAMRCFVASKGNTIELPEELTT